MLVSKALNQGGYLRQVELRNLTYGEYPASHAQAQKTLTLMGLNRDMLLFGDNYS